MKTLLEPKSSKTSLLTFWCIPVLPRQLSGRCHPDGPSHYAFRGSHCTVHSMNSTVNPIKKAYISISTGTHTHTHSLHTTRKQKQTKNRTQINCFNNHKIPQFHTIYDESKSTALTNTSHNFTQCTWSSTENHCTPSLHKLSSILFYI